MRQEFVHLVNIAVNIRKLLRRSLIFITSWPSTDRQAVATALVLIIITSLYNVKFSLCAV